MAEEKKVQVKLADDNPGAFLVVGGVRITKGDSATPAEVTEAQLKDLNDQGYKVEKTKALTESDSGQENGS